MIAEDIAGVIPRIRPKPTPVPIQQSRTRTDNRLLVVGLVVTDLVALSAATSVTGGLRLVLDEFLPVATLGFPERHALASLLVLPVLIGLFALHGLYDRDSILAGSREYARIGNAVTYGVVIVLVSSFLFGEGPLVSRSWLALLWLTSVLFAGLGRFAARRVVRRLRRGGLLQTRVVIVGASEFGVSFAEQLRAASSEGIQVVGFLDEYIPIGQPLLGDVAVIGRPSDLVRGRLAARVDEYLLVPQALPHERLAEITRLMVARHAPTVRMAVTSSDLLTHGLVIAQRASVPVVTMKRARITGIDAILKRGLDLFGATVALVGLGPLALVVLVRSLVTHRHDVLIREDVCGACGEPTSFVVFDLQGVRWPLLRGVPALLSVLLGRLSLVGPRPMSVGTVPAGDAELGLTAVKPGLTGPWRLSGPEASLADQALRDLAYVRDYTIWEDLRIICDSLWSLMIDSNHRRLARWQDSLT